MDASASASAIARTHPLICHDIKEGVVLLNWSLFCRCFSTLIYSSRYINDYMRIWKFFREVSFRYIDMVALMLHYIKT